jgi:hypothetical protein
MMENGNHTGAANLFERLARGAEDFGKPRLAPNLNLQAGRANILGGYTERGEALLIQGLTILAKSKRWTALAGTGQRVLLELHQMGHPEITDHVSKWLTATLPEPIESYQHRHHQTAIQLSLKCPFCGGALRPGEIEMHDEVTGECPYCGSALRGK